MPKFRRHTASPIVEETRGQKVGKAWFLSVDPKCAYGQVLLREEKSKKYNFAIMGGKTTGVYCSGTGFCDLSVMATKVQGSEDEILMEQQTLSVSISHILEVTKRPGLSI